MENIQKVIEVLGAKIKDLELQLQLKDWQIEQLKKENEELKGGKENE